MSTRNKLLERIVLALGGTVTNPNNRNQLLLDWLTALGDPVPPTRLAPNFNGVSQYAEVPLQSFTIGSPNLKLSYIRKDTNSGTSEQPLCSGGGNFILVRDRNNANYPDSVIVRSTNATDINFENCITELDGEFVDLEFEFTANESVVYVNGRRYSVSLQVGTFDITNIGRRIGNNTFAGFPILRYSVGDGSVYNFPMDDGWANNPTMRNTGSGADGTFINMTEASWVEVSV